MSKKTFGVCLMALLASMVNGFSASAQNDTINTVDRSVDVVNAYQPTLRRSKKINVEPIIDDTVKYSDSFKYQTLKRVSTVTTKPEPLSAAGMDFPVYNSPYRAVVEAGVGTLPSFYGQILYNNGNSENHHLSLKAGHLAQLGKVKLEDDGKVEAHQNDTWAGLVYNHFGGNLRFGFDVDFANNAYSCYGQNTIVDTVVYMTEDAKLMKGSDILSFDKQRNTSFDFMFDIGNSIADPLQKFTFKAFAGFGIWGNKSGVGQTDIHFGGRLRFPIKKVAGFDADLVVNTFKTKLGDESDYYDFVEHKGTDIHVEPHFRMDYDFMALRLGVRIISVIGDDYAGKDDFIVQPDLRVKFFIGDGSVKLSAGLTGDFSQNSMRSLVEQNKYVSADARKYAYDGLLKRYLTRNDIFHSQAPIIFNLDLRGSFSKTVQAGIGMTFKSLGDEVFFVNRHFATEADTTIVGYAPQFAILQDDGKLFGVHGDINVKPTANSNILFEIAYNNYNMNSLDEAWNRPKLVLSLSGKCKPTERLGIKAKLSYEGERKAYDPTTGEATTLDGFIDLNVGGNYYISNRWTAFLNINNIVAADQQRWLGYSSYSFNAMAGITYKF
ncbi:MAG: hypothetical protein MR215_05810 [Bacteroidales bacterium]|nr:hypothetical protein [Bacteroidales bacterium]